ncbi:hypothetical protein SAMN05443247_06256 [Bradyrhizobium erythrophlei]|jgi:hypothetical protein|nr:hypothetical protein SAMN05443247_06256 [Bradyrhizobium erythrophlei]
MSISLEAVKPAVNTSSTHAVERVINNPRRTKRLIKYAVAVAARLVMFSVLSPIGAAAHQEDVWTITATATSMSDEGYVEAVTHDRNDIIDGSTRQLRRP